ncbi:MAG: helix-turn-helix transcriptional regulator [bacterium]
MAENDMEHWYADGVATFGDRLEAARAAAQLSQKDLAMRLGVRDSTVKAWEADEWEPRANRMQMLAGMLNVSMGWLMAGVGEGIPAPHYGAAAPKVQVTMAELSRLRQQLQALGQEVALVERRLAAELHEVLP